jgi:hypothetical protein
MVQGRLDYLDQESEQTLGEAIGEYYARHPELLDPESMSPRAAELFREHDAAHVAFGCDTSLRGETLVDTWTVFGSAAGLRGYLEYFRYPQVNQVFAQTGYARIALALLRCLPDVARVIARSRRLSAKWPLGEYSRRIDQPLRELRREFNIRVV